MSNLKLGWHATTVRTDADKVIDCSTKLIHQVLDNTVKKCAEQAIEGAGKSPHERGGKGACIVTDIALCDADISNAFDYIGILKEID
jgi:hypothetical protein